MAYPALCSLHRTAPTDHPPPPPAPQGTSRACPFTVNVPYELLEIISDCKHLEVLGFPLPELAINVALQEDRYRRHSVSLTAMVDRLNGVLACMTDPEVSGRGGGG